MKRWKDRSLIFRTAFLLSTIVSIIAFASVSILLYQFLNEEKQLTKKYAVSETKSYANDIESLFSNAETITRTFGQYMLFAKENRLTREQVLEHMHELLSDNDQLLGIYTLWEPNQFDGKDVDYANTEGHDLTGRFVPYVVRSNGTIIVEASRDYDKEGAGDYYLIPKNTKKPLLLEPYNL